MRNPKNKIKKISYYSNSIPNSDDRKIHYCNLKYFLEIFTNKYQSWHVLDVDFEFEFLRFLDKDVADAIFDPLVRFVLNGSDPVHWFIDQLIALFKKPA